MKSADGERMESGGERGWRPKQPPTTTQHRQFNCDMQTQHVYTNSTPIPIHSALQHAQHSDASMHSHISICVPTRTSSWHMILQSLQICDTVHCTAAICRNQFIRCIMAFVPIHKLRFLCSHRLRLQTSTCSSPLRHTSLETVRRNRDCHPMLGAGEFPAWLRFRCLRPLELKTSTCNSCCSSCHSLNWV